MHFNVNNLKSIAKKKNARETIKLHRVWHRVTKELFSIFFRQTIKFV